jgi:micrococcal nuclease
MPAMQNLPRSARSSLLLPLLAAASLLFPLPVASAAPQAAPAAPAKAALEQPGWKLAPPTELHEVEKVVDGDTVHILRGGKLEKLRLNCVDTEEKMATNSNDPTKPSTTFGEDCAQWAAKFFADLAEPGQKPKVGLLFANGMEERDVYGRLLCHLILPDGRNFNLLLVELGKSPYFNKYGNDLICHQAFVDAQARARKAQKGIWDPKTNVPKTEGAPSARRPYEQLLPWWEARALAIDGYRAAAKKDAAHVAAADMPHELERALESSAKGEDVEIFGTIQRIFHEDDGTVTVLFRTGDKQPAFRAKFAREHVGIVEKLGLDKRDDEEFVQNYLWVRGRVAKGPRGFDMTCADAAKWRVAGPEPVEPAAAGR